MPAKASPEPPSSIDIPPRLRTALPYLALAVAVLAAYANVYGNTFLLDDEQWIVNNALLRHWDSIGAIFSSSSTAGVGGSDLFYRPLQQLIYLVIYQLAGISTFWFHVPNVVLHAANAGLLYALGKKLGFKPMAAFLGALLWALHPIQTEAVTYISATVEPLYAFFCLLGLCLLAPDFTPRKYLAVCPLLFLGLLSKETAVVLPLLAMACQFLIDKGRLRAAAYFRTWPLWLTIAGYFLLRYLVLHNGDHFVFYKRQNLYTEHVLYRIYTFLATLPLYAKLILWPSGLHMSHAFDVYVNFSEPAVLGGAALMLATLAWIVKGRGKRGLPLGWGLLWFGFSYAPVSGILVPLNALFLEHWMYLPTAGLFLGAAESIARWAESLPRKTAGRIAAGFAITAALALGIKTHMQNTHWRDPITFYSYIVAQGTDSAAVYNNLGNAYLDNGEVGRAIPAFRKAITLYDHFAQTHHNLALALLNLPDRKVHIPEAIAELKRALAINPNFYQSCELLANIYAYTGDRRDEAFYRVKDEALRRKFHIPPNIYREPVLTP